VAETVDAFLRGERVSPQIRLRQADGTLEELAPEQVGYGWTPALQKPQAEAIAAIAKAAGRRLRIFPYGINRSKLEKALVDLGMEAEISKNARDADVVLALKAYHRREGGRLRESAGAAPIYILRANTYHQIMLTLREVFKGKPRLAEEIALRTAEQAIQQVLSTTQAVELPPAPANMRRLQHRLANQYGVTSQSIGVEPKRRVKITLK
jgi:hypothetical protein